MVRALRTPRPVGSRRERGPRRGGADARGGGATAASPGFHCCARCRFRVLRGGVFAPLVLRALRGTIARRVPLLPKRRTAKELELEFFRASMTLEPTADVRSLRSFSIFSSRFNVRLIKYNRTRKFSIATNTRRTRVFGKFRITRVLQREVYQGRHKST